MDKAVGSFWNWQIGEITTVLFIQTNIVISNWPNIEQLIGLCLVCTIRKKFCYFVRDADRSQDNILWMVHNVFCSWSLICLLSCMMSHWMTKYPLFRSCVAWQVHRFCSGLWGHISLCVWGFWKVEITQPQIFTVHSLQQGLLFLSHTYYLYIIKYLLSNKVAKEIKIYANEITYFDSQCTFLFMTKKSCFSNQIL